MAFTQDKILNALGCALALGIMLGLSHLSDMAIARVPFATSIVLVLAASDTEYAQPRNIIGGHIVSALSGLLAVSMFGHGMIVAMVAIFLAVLLMQILRVMHPPAGIDPLIVATEQIGWSFLLVPVGVGALLLVGFAIIWQRVALRRPWPLRWR